MQVQLNRRASVVCCLDEFNDKSLKVDSLKNSSVVLDSSS